MAGRSLSAGNSRRRKQPWPLGMSSDRRHQVGEEAAVLRPNAKAADGARREAEGAGHSKVAPRVPCSKPLRSGCDDLPRWLKTPFIAFRIEGLLHRATKANCSIPIQDIDFQHIGTPRTRAGEFPRQIHHDAWNVIVEGRRVSYSVISSKLVRDTHRGPCLIRHNRLEASRCKSFLVPRGLCQLCRPELHHDSPNSH
jgi:hypothetical protein